MLTWKIPKREYAISSTRVVPLYAIQAIFSATLHVERSAPASISGLIPVMLLSLFWRDFFVPIVDQSAARNSTVLGAMSSWRVQPLRNHRLDLKIPLGSG